MTKDGEAHTLCDHMINAGVCKEVSKRGLGAAMVNLFPNSMTTRSFGLNLAISAEFLVPFGFLYDVNRLEVVLAFQT